MRSLTDSNSMLEFGRNTANGEAIQFVYRTDPDNPVALTLDNRQIVLDGGGAGQAILNNQSGLPMTINKDLGWTSATGNRTFQLTGAGGGSFNGDLGNHPDSGALAMTFANSWTLTGNSTYTGMTNILAGATAEFQGTAAMPDSASLIRLSKSSTIRILTDDAGTVNLGNNIELDRTDNSTGIIQNYIIHAGNNGGATTGSTVVLGNVDFTKNDLRPPRQITTTGANGYSVEIGDVMLWHNLQGTATGGAQRFTPSTASLEITGTVKHINGDNGSRANAHSLYLGGAMTGNLISGMIADADDYTNESNEFARPLSIYKDGAGDWTFSGTNTYTGTTTINAGTLKVNGDQSAAIGDVFVNGTSTLGGSGTLGGNVTLAAGAKLEMGNSVGTLTILGNLDISAMAGGDGQLFYDLGLIAASDQLAVTGTLDIGDGLLGLGDFDFTNLGSLQEGVYILITSSGITGTLDGTNLEGTIGETDITLGTNGNSIILTVGEPSGTPYELWATGGELFGADANGDGVSNGLAFLLGASGPNVSALGLLPTVSETGGGLVMTFSMLNSANRGTAALSVEHSSDLGIADDWTTVLVPDTAGISGPTNGVTFNVTLGSPSNSVTATISSSEAAFGKLFGRLVATE